MPTGTIARLLIDKGFGFIRDEGGIEHFFHRSAVRGAVFELLREGQRVEFTPEESAKGPRAGDSSADRRLAPVIPRPGIPRAAGRRALDSATAGPDGPVTAASAPRISHPRKCASPSKPVVCRPAASVVESVRKRTGPGGPPGLQNRSLPALRGGWVRLPGASASLRSTSAGFSPRSSFGWASQLLRILLGRASAGQASYCASFSVELRLGKPASPRARRLTTSAPSRTRPPPRDRGRRRYRRASRRLRCARRRDRSPP